MIGTGQTVIINNMKHIKDGDETILVAKDLKQYKPTKRHILDKIKSLEKHISEWETRKERSTANNRENSYFNDKWYDNIIERYRKEIAKLNKKLEKLK